jgi:4-amino-4-deoxy-L-arabinose transferase-like glycosyltransferase
MAKLIAIILLWMFLWWLGDRIVSGYQAGNPAFVDVYQTILQSVSGVRK